MRARRLVRALIGDLRRNLPHMVIAGLGIASGVGLMIVLVALGLQVRDVVLHRILPITQLEVVPSRAHVDVWAFRLGLGPELLDDEAVDQLRTIPGVDEVYPKMELVAPAVLSGGAGLLGQEIFTEVVADGIASDLVADDVASGYDMVDPDPAGSGQPCRLDSSCPQPQFCAASEEIPPPEGEGVCRDPVPVLISPHLVEMFNGAIRRAHGFPAINPDVAIGLTAEVTIGASMFRSSRRATPERIRVRLVGFSDKAIPLGLTLPLETVRRLNRMFGSPEDAERYHSAILVTTSAGVVGRVVEAVRAQGLEVSDQGSLRAAALISIFLAAAGLLGGLIVIGSAANVMHVQLLMVAARRHEIALLRAVGASRRQIRLLVVCEAALLGAVAGVGGWLGAVVGMAAADLGVARLLPAFPYKPETFFAVPLWLPAAAMLFAVLFCTVGALIPASRAARLGPASMLADR